MSTKKTVISASAAIGIYAIFFLVSGNGAVTPAIAAFAVQFPEVSTTNILFLNNLPSIFTLIGTLLMGALIGTKVKFKPAGIVALILYIVMGIAPFFFESSLMGVIVARAIWGFSAGLIAPIGASAFLRLVRDKDARATYLGRGSAWQQVGCILLTLAGGWLTAVGWKYTFLAYGVGIFALIAFVVWFQEPPSLKEIMAQEGDVAAEDFKKAERIKIPAKAWFFIGIFFFGQLAFMPGVMDFAILMSTKVPGQDALSVGGMAGTLLSLLTVAGAISTAVTDKFVKAFGKFTGLFAFVIAAAGMVCIGIATSYFMFGLGILLLGFGWILAIPVINLEVGMLTPASGV
ncbi:MAG: MFS transporter, partial [Actinobacteria bacterium]|nr:MFS transporter [Actinomycetota bacterium]